MAFSVNATAAAALLLATSFFAVPAVSQQLEMPSNEAIQKIMQEQAASRSAALNGKIDPVKPGTFKATVPVIDAPAPTKTESLDDVIARFNAAKQGAKGGHGANDFIIFVSFSMPKDRLERLAQQARETGAVMVVRGFKNGSQMQTKQAALEVNKAGVPWEINPNLFKAFKVESYQRSSWRLQKQSPFWTMAAHQMPPSRRSPATSAQCWPWIPSASVRSLRSQSLPRPGCRRSTNNKPLAPSTDHDRARHRAGLLVKLCKLN